MNETVTEAHNFYLPFQILASCLLAVISWLIGLFLAWLIWGRHSKQRAQKLEQENAKLRAST